VTATFEDQKNGKKWDSHSQRQTAHHMLCLVKCWASIVQQILRMLPSTTPSTPVNAIHINGNTHCSSPTVTPRTYSSLPAIYMGANHFGFHADKIGNKSICSGTAMVFFLAYVPTAKIMILGYWSSDAFLAYIHPQVLEWTSNMRPDMTHLNSFLDVGSGRHANAANPPTKTKALHPFNGSFIVLPQFHLNH
jgi:hypothetical protein